MPVSREERLVIDPTKNVLDLVNAERAHRDALREIDNKRQDELREAETRRINELAAQKQTFDLELAKVLRANQDAASTLLATQLKEVKNDLSDRTAKLEQFRWETGGKGMGLSSAAGWIAFAVTAAIGIATYLKP
jgi:hypothetical protein